jgi:surface polysaccharide O-acyltransferase-like enzyme
MAVFDWRICGLQFISFYFFFYILGSFIRKYDIKITQSLCLFLGASWLLTAIFWKGHEIPVPLLGFDMVQATILIYGYRYLSATLGALFLIGLSPYCFTELDNYLNKALCYLGTSSLGIYIVHAFVAHMLDYYHLIEKYFDSTTSMSYTLTFYIICAVSGIGLTYVLSQNRCFCYLFLGK